MGSGFINYFNKFGRQWQVYIQAEGEYRTNIENVGQFYVRNSEGATVPLGEAVAVILEDGETLDSVNIAGAHQVANAAKAAESAPEAEKPAAPV